MEISFKTWFRNSKIVAAFYWKKMLEVSRFKEIVSLRELLSISQ